jgi:Integrase
MGAKSQAIRSIHAANNHLGGAVATRVHRKGHCTAFVGWCFDNGYPIGHIKDVSFQAGMAYFDHLRNPPIQTAATETQQRKPLSNSTLHNHLGSIRRALNAHKVNPDSMGFTAQAMGLNPKSRAGKKQPISDEHFAVANARAYAIGQPGLAILLKLERYLGHRGQEAIMSTTQLKRFAQECRDVLEGNLPLVTIADGTKGGRVRQVAIIGALAQETMHTIAEALHYVSQHGYLIQGKAGTLKSARAAYHRLVREVGLQGQFSPHSLRYRYCVDKLTELRDLQVPRREALRLCAEYLGHGPSRGRFVTMVYGRSMEETLPKTRMRQDYLTAANIVDTWLQESPSMAATSAQD